MKKIFAQPELMVVNIKKCEIVTTSNPELGLDLGSAATSDAGIVGSAGRRFDDWDAGY